MPRETYDHPPQLLDGVPTCEACGSTQLRQLSDDWADCAACGSRYALTDSSADEARRWAAAGADITSPPAPASNGPAPMPPAPSKKSTATVMAAAIGFLVVVVLAVYLTTRGSGSDDYDPSAYSAASVSEADLSSTVSVIYTVTVDSTQGHIADSITYQTPTGDSQATSQETPWTYSDDFDPGSFLYVSAQNAGGGSITCSITVAGEVVSNNTATGEYAIATCQG